MNVRRKRSRRRGTFMAVGRDNWLQFTNMRAAALEQLYQDFELRDTDMFRGVHEHVRFLLDCV